MQEETAENFVIHKAGSEIYERVKRARPTIWQNQRHVQRTLERVKQDPPNRWRNTPIEAGTKFPELYDLGVVALEVLSPDVLAVVDVEIAGDRTITVIRRDVRLPTGNDPEVLDSREQHDGTMLHIVTVVVAGASSSGCRIPVLTIRQ
jgi:hypothetical protein